MCCPALFEPNPDQLREWVAGGCTLIDASPDESSDAPGVWRALVHDPRGFPIAFRADESVLRAVFGLSSLMARPSDRDHQGAPLDG